MSDQAGWADRSFLAVAWVIVASAGLVFAALLAHLAMIVFGSMCSVMR